MRKQHLQSVACYGLTPFHWMKHKATVIFLSAESHNRDIARLERVGHIPGWSEASVFFSLLLWLLRNLWKIFLLLCQGAESMGERMQNLVEYFSKYFWKFLQSIFSKFVVSKYFCSSTFPGEFPHLVLITRGCDGSLMCTGSLVSEKAVVTAGHCCDG